MTLIEIMVAIFILAVAVIAVASTASASLVSLRISRDRQQAADAASSAIEDARTYAYDELVLDDACTTSTPSCSPAPNGEVLVTEPGGPIAFERTYGQNNDITVLTYVTWVAQGAVAQGAKRLTVVASWSDRGGVVRSVEQSTIVAEAERGLPAPEFVWNPTDPILTVPPDAGGTRSCIHHVLGNIGAADTYEWRLTSQGNTTQVSGELGTFLDSDSKWEARGYITLIPEGAGSSSPPAGLEDDDPANDGDAVLMRDTNSDSWMEATDGFGDQVRVATGQSAYISICYEAPPSPVNSVFTATIRSRFDSQVQQTATHTIQVASFVRALYLNDPDNTKDHQRANNPKIFSVSLTAPTQTSLYDYDTNRDPDGLPGVWLPANGDQSEGVALIWDYQPTSTITIDEATVRLWATSATAANIRVRFRLEERDKSGNNPVVLYPTTASDPNYLDFGITSGGGSLANSADISFPARSIDVASNGAERLRLTVWCDAASQDDCHVLYDAVIGGQTPSRVVVRRG